MPYPTTIFPDKPAAVADLRANQLMLAAANALPGVTVSDDTLYSKLLVAEADVARLLKVYLMPTKIVPDDASQAELDALEAGSMPWAQEAAYDYGPEMWQGERWGYIKTQSVPVIAVEGIRFVYPAPTQQFFAVPQDWVRVDRKFGHIRLVPATTAFTAPLNAFLMQAMGGGMTIPFMVQVRYTAGLTDVATKWPDLVDVIKRKAVLKLVMDSYLPQSGSVSADGLSQSMSMDLTKYGDAIDEALFGPKGRNGGLWAAIHGIGLGVLG